MVGVFFYGVCVLFLTVWRCVAKNITLHIDIQCTFEYAVAPLAGAWIETARATAATPGSMHVAPLAGAWIETL